MKMLPRCLTQPSLASLISNVGLLVPMVPWLMYQSWRTVSGKQRSCQPAARLKELHPPNPAWSLGNTFCQWTIINVITLAPHPMDFNVIQYTNLRQLKPYINSALSSIPQLMETRGLGWAVGSWGQAPSRLSTGFLGCRSKDLRCGQKTIDSIEWSRQGDWKESKLLFHPLGRKTIMTA